MLINANLFGKILSLVSVQGSSNLDLKHFIFSFNLVNLFAYSSSTWVSYWPYSPLHFKFHKLCCRSKIFVQLSNGESIVITYVGIVQLTTTLTLYNFLYKPSFSFNLIFVSQLTNSLKFCLKASFGRREWNGMERNEKNNFRIFFPSLVWEF